MAARDTLIVQFRTQGDPADFDRLIAIEEALGRGFSQNGAGRVDGHDYGSGIMNLFISPKGSWSRCIDVVLAYLKHRGELGNALVVKRLKSERYQVVWPEGFRGDFERV